MKEMRRKEKKLDLQAAVAILEQGEYGILSTADEQNRPYGVPLNYVYQDNSVYFHAALDGHKIENIRKNPQVSFCVVGDSRIIPAALTTHYESVIVFGKGGVIKGDERYRALMLLAEKYASGHMDTAEEEIARLDRKTIVIKIEIETISGKANPVER